MEDNRMKEVFFDVLDQLIEDNEHLYGSFRNKSRNVIDIDSSSGNGSGNGGIDSGGIGGGIDGDSGSGDGSDCCYNEMNECEILEEPPSSGLEFYTKFVSQNKPVLIKNAVNHWPALRKWHSNVYLRQIMKDRQVHVSVTPNGRADAVTNVYRHKGNDQLFYDSSSWIKTKSTESIINDMTNLNINDNNATENIDPNVISCEKMFVEPENRKMKFSTFMNIIEKKRKLTLKNDSTKKSIHTNLVYGKYNNNFNDGNDINGNDHVYNEHHKKNDMNTDNSIHRSKKDCSKSINEFDDNIVDVSDNDDFNDIHYIQYQNNNFINEFEPLWKDVPGPINFANEAFQHTKTSCTLDATNLWIGTEDSVSSLHRDHYENMYVVLSGEKHFILYPPYAYPLLHPKNEMYRAGRFCKMKQQNKWRVTPSENGSKIPWISIDAENFHHKTRLKIVVKAGECLYLPSLWYHQVSQVNDKEGKVIAINYWYDMQFGPMYSYAKFIERMYQRCLDSSK